MHAGAGAGARGTRHGTLAREKKSLGELGSVWERLAGAEMAAEETRMAAATIVTPSSSSLSCWPAV